MEKRFPMYHMVWDPVPPKWLPSVDLEGKLESCIKWGNEPMGLKLWIQIIRSIVEGRIFLAKDNSENWLRGGPSTAASHAFFGVPPKGSCMGRFKKTMRGPSVASAPRSQFYESSLAKKILPFTLHWSAWIQSFRPIGSFPRIIRLSNFPATGSLFGGTGS